jgi:hypothetical protein
MPIWRGLCFEVSASAVDDGRLVVAGWCRDEPLGVGDRFVRMRPAGGGEAADRPCSLVIERILSRGRYVTWIDGNREPEAELELSGDPAQPLPVGVELRGESGEYLPAFEVLGRGERRLPPS